MSETSDTSTSVYSQCISEAEYLRVEETAKQKHEYVAGLLFAMHGATMAHNRLVASLSHRLFDPVSDAGCNVFTNDMKVRIASLQSFYYPDLIVTCEKLDLTAVFVESPCLIVEVLSKSTTETDRREKLQAYRTIPALREYLLVHQDKVWIEMFRKDDAECWQCSEYKKGSIIQLRSLPDATLDLALDDIYKGLDFGD